MDEPDFGVSREEARERFKQDALRAWEAYQSNGLHLTMAEADAWLEKLEAGEDAELPRSVSTAAAQHPSL